MRRRGVARQPADNWPAHTLRPGDHNLGSCGQYLTQTMQQMAKLLTYILIKIVLWNLPAPARRSFLLCKFWVLYDVTSWSSLVLAKMQRKDWPQWPEGEAIRWFSGAEGGTGHQGADRSVVSRSCCVINMTRSDQGWPVTAPCPTLSTDTGGPVN